MADEIDYRQNPTKIYNGVRHQTSMCKAFVKLPRPFGDQSGGARKWAIRAGCETWFSNGGYNPPGYHGAAKRPTSSSGSGAPLGASGSAAVGGKAKSTARSKQLAIGTGIGLTSPRSSPYGSPGNGGPSVGPAYDGTSKPYYPPQYPLSGYAAPPPPPPSQYLPPGYHYVPVSAAQGHPNGGQPMYVPVWNPYSSTSSSSANTAGTGGNGNGNGGGATPSQMSQGHLQQPPTPASSYHTMGLQNSWGSRYGMDEKGSPDSYDGHIQGRMSPTSAHGSDQ